MRTLSKIQTHLLMIDSPILKKAHTRGISPKDEWDFGEPSSVGLHLKRADIRDHIYQPKDVPVYGIYLGQHHGEEVVAVKTVTFPTEVMCGEAFPSLEELKKRWRLD